MMAKRVIVAQPFMRKRFATVARARPQQSARRLDTKAYGELVALLASTLSLIIALGYCCAYAYDHGWSRSTAMPSALFDLGATEALKTSLPGLGAAIACSIALFCHLLLDRTRHRGLKFVWLCGAIVLPLGILYIWLPLSARISLAAVVVLVALAALRRTSFGVYQIRKAEPGLLIFLAVFVCIPLAIYDAFRRGAEEWTGIGLHWVVPGKDGAPDYVLLRISGLNAVAAPLAPGKTTFGRDFKVIELKGVEVHGRFFRSLTPANVVRVARPDVVPAHDSR